LLHSKPLFPLAFEFFNKKITINNLYINARTNAECIAVNVQNPCIEVLS